MNRTLPRMRSVLGVGSIVFFGGTAFAQDQEAGIVISTDARLRYERVEVENNPLNAEAVTLRLRTAADIPLSSNIHFSAEADAIIAFNDGFEDFVGGPTGRPGIADAETLELNRLSLSWEAPGETEVTVGRQRILFDDERFVGAVGFRQNDQTFDAVRVSSAIGKNLQIEAAYIGQTNRIFGTRSDRETFKGNSALLNVSGKTPIGQITAFHYALDLSDSVGGIQSEQFSSQTTGVRFDGQWNADPFGLKWAASIAVQEDFADQEADYSADYSMISATAILDRVTINLRREVLGADENASFQAPIGTLHKFQGDADIFLVTPPDGIVDQSVFVKVNVPGTKQVRGVSAFARYHEFDADRGGAHYGDEWDFGVSAKVAGTKVAVNYAAYQADRFATDTDKVWVTLARRY